MTHTTMQDDTGEAVDPQWTEPLWNWERIDIEMGKAYKAHGYTYQFIWVRELLRQVCDEYERDRANFQAIWEQYISKPDSDDLRQTIATQAARIAELERRIESVFGGPQHLFHLSETELERYAQLSPIESFTLYLKAEKENATLRQELAVYEERKADRARWGYKEGE